MDVSACLVYYLPVVTVTETGGQLSVVSLIEQSHSFSLAWGTVPEGVGTVLTSLSILIAALAYRRRVADRQREQASRLNAWVEVVNGDKDGGFQIVLRNDSDLPIRYLLVEWDTDDSLRSGEPYQAWHMMLQPKSEERTKWKKYLDPDTPISVAFLDAAGRYWLRSKDGELSRIKGVPPYAADTYRWMKEVNQYKE